MTSQETGPQRERPTSEVCLSCISCFSITAKSSYNMVLENDLRINGSRLHPDAVTEVQRQFNENLIAIGRKSPKWFEVSFHRLRAF